MFHIKGSFSIKRCQSCTQVFLDPQLTKKELAPYYPSTKYYAYKGGGKKGFFQRIREYLVLHHYRPTIISKCISLIVHDAPAIPRKVKNGKVLDVGCGTGDTLVLLEKLGWEAYGMDIDEKALAVAKKRGITHVRQGFIEDVARYPDNFFDAIRLYHVIEHVNDPAAAITLLSKKLKKGGELILGTPNVDSLASSLFGTYWYNLDSPRHLFLFSPATLMKLVRASRFTNLTVEFCSAGGVVGSLQYWFRDKLKLKVDLIHSLWWVLIFYPLEWILDKMRLGDVFVLRARK